MKKIIVLTTAFVLFSLNFCYAADIIREHNIAKSIENSFSGGKIVELMAGTRSFLGIYREGVLPMKQGGIILVHDINQNADSPAIIRTLRNGLIESGWDTLSIQMPVGDRFANRNDYFAMLPDGNERIKAAVQFYMKKNDMNLGVIGHGFGAKNVVQSLAKSPMKAVSGIILIGMDSSDDETKNALENLNLPILDLYGSQDLPLVLETTPKRQRASSFKAGNANYLQYRKIGADHYFTGLQGQLLSTVRAWIDRYIAGNEIFLGNNGKNARPAAR